MQPFTAHTFTIPELQGISTKNIEEHMKLYQGYVKHANLINEHMAELMKDSEKYAYELGELQRRFSFEFDGMRNHEYYFHSLEGGAQAVDTAGAFVAQVTKDFGSWDAFMARTKGTALTRGIGWTILFYDKKNSKLILQWVDEQHVGHLTDCAIVLALDMWEHSYVADYQPSGKKQYVEDFFANLNWKVIEANFASAS